MIKDLIDFLDNVKEREVAIDLLNVLAKHAKSFEQFDELSQSFFKLKLYEPAISLCEFANKSSKNKEQKHVSRCNLINLYNHANYPEKAMELIEEIEDEFPDDIDNQLEKAFSLFLLNRKDEAEQVLLTHLNDKNLSEEIRTKINFNLGTYCLYRDEFIKGLSLFLLEGQKLNFWRSPSTPTMLKYKFWQGESVAPGKTILLHAEAGIGDEFINIRFIKHLKNLGMNPVWYSDRKDLVDIFNENGYTASTSLKDIPSGSLWTYPMSLPVYLNLEYKDLWDGPYLKSVKEFDSKYEWMNNTNKLKIGVRWQGNPMYDQDLHRSVLLKDIMETLVNIDADIYSLQRDTGLDELDFYPNIKDMSKEMDSFSDTLSIINNLDLIITSCTSIAHAAAAMGKRTIILTPISAYYTWSHSTKQSPWYGDNVTLLRQTTPRKWEEPFSELKQIMKSYDSISN